jgi:peptide-methionine (R)-S-oxide reductase
MDRRAFLTSGMKLGALAGLASLVVGTACSNENLTAAANNAGENLPPARGNAVNAASGEGDILPFKKVVKTNAEWKRILTPQQFEVARKGGTEAPYSSPLNKMRKKGIYACVCCSLPLFSSKTKFESGTGWPSFYAPIEKINVLEKTDNSLAETRTEVLCNRCDAHLGHVFDDGPAPTGLRYCMNGVAMKFIKAA